MNPVSFISNLKNTLADYFSPEVSQVGNTIAQFFPSKTNSLRPDGVSAAPNIVAAAPMETTQTPSIPKPSPMKGENDWVAMMMQKNPSQDSNHLHDLYKRAVGSPGGHPYEATPAPIQNATSSQAQYGNRPGPEVYQAGFNRFAPNTPVATASAAFSQAGKQLPPHIDPLLPAIVALLETGGGKNVVGANNAFNLSGTQNGKAGFVSYPNFSTALLGGDNNGVQSQGFIGTILNNPAYKKFLDSGKLEDFFKVYTPPGEQYGNPTPAQLIDRYNSLRALFPTR